MSGPSYTLANNGKTAQIEASRAEVDSICALVDELFAGGVIRIWAAVLPEDLEAAMALESTGFIFEGEQHNSFLQGELHEVDWLYGVTPELRNEWVNRDRSFPESIELVEPYPIGLRHVIALGVHKSQERFVSPIAASLAQVAVPPPEDGFENDPDGPLVEPWPRIIHADGEPVGFVMMSKPSEHGPEPYLWRLLIDRMHQRRGVGRRAVELVIEQARSWGAPSLLVTWVPGVGSPEALYTSLGFVPTGEMEEDEVVARLTLA